MTVLHATISMPHRHCVRYEVGEIVIEFETEPHANSLVFYAADPKIINGTMDDAPDAEKAVIQWLKQKFELVEVDHSPKPSF